jgi:hypothetical protein
MASKAFIFSDLPPNAVVFRHNCGKPAEWPYDVLWEDDKLVVSASYDIGASASQGRWRIRVDIYEA